MSNLKVKYLSGFFILISVLSFFNIVYSYYFNLYLNLNTYFYTLLVSLLFGIILYKVKPKSKNSNIFEKILTILFGYILIPIVLSIPFYFSIYNLSYLNSLFESVSGFTSTGFSVFDNIKHIDQSIIMWRSTIQWIGGLYFLFSIIYLIDIYDESLKKSLTNFFSFNNSEILKQITKVFILYTLLTFFIFLVLNISGIRTFNSFNLAMTIISSGGFLPVNDLSVILNSDFKRIVFSFLMLISFFSIFFVYNLIFFKNRNKDFFYEDFHLILYLVILLFIFFLFFSFDNDFINIMFNIFSSISNIGFSINIDQPNSVLIYLILVIIGGSFFSTSSGLRFIKIFSLLRYSFNQMLLFSKPKNIFINKLVFSNINFDFDVINKYFLSIIIFILSLSIATSLLSFFGINFEQSFKIAILALMNTVNSSVYGLDAFDFNNIFLLNKYLLIFFMIIGRIELLTLLLLIKRFLLKD